MERPYSDDLVFISSVGDPAHLPAGQTKKVALKHDYMCVDACDEQEAGLELMNSFVVVRISD